ncbi:ComEC/Rec2 family competence protein [Flaviflexus huanghaiensis]|uniref:ComEC/Rec2 family competence protein n=1 Tax=Flaviflexus huanghaiensis TaxID=1111473 RepID=UPI0015FD37E5|nr:ComEC/Rec2 family competence protein [Flaviflexus huanghaiensis]
MTHRDLRILLAALGWWAAAIGTLLEGAGFVMTCVSFLAGSFFCGRLVLRHVGRDSAVRFWGPTVVVLISAAICSSGLTAAHQYLAGQGILARLTEQRAVVHLAGSITSYPNPAGERVLRSMRVERVTGRGEVSSAYSSVALLGGDELVNVNLGEHIDVLVKLEPTDRGSREIAWATVVGEPTVTGHAGPVSRWIATRADRLSANLRHELPQIQGLVPGLAIGDDSRLPEEHGEALAAVNLTHLTAVSGSHVSMICGIALVLVGRRRRARAVIVAGGVLAVLIVATGGQPSVLRAGVMGAVVLSAIWLRRPSSALPALGVSIIVLVGLEPSLALAYGFILSVVSTAAIIVWARPAASLLAPILTVPGANLLAVPIVAHLACAPIILLLSDSASIWSALANALVAPVVPAGTIVALAGLLLAPAPAVGPALAWIAARCVSWIDIVAGELSGWPGSGMDGRLVAAVYAALLLAAWLTARTRLRTTWLVAAALGLSAYRLVPTPVPDWDIVQCDVGQGAATLVRVDGLVYLVDTGPPGSRLGDCLSAAGADVDILILTHLHADHVGEIRTALNRGVTEVWAGPGMQFEVESMVGDRSVREVSAGDRFGGLEILWPQGPADCYDESCENDNSVVVRANVGRSFLITGDIELSAQRQLARHDVAADVVLVPHHGSPRQSEAFADAVGATLALLSYGENSYGHPAPATVELYSRGAEIMATEDGDIFLRVAK